MTADAFAVLESALFARAGELGGGEIHFLCPAHDDHDPSARYHPEKRTWFCDACQAGGGAKDLAKRLGVPEPEIAAANGRGKPDTEQPRRIVATYDYVDLQGELRMQSVRYDPKDFRQRRPDGTNGWIWKMDGIVPILYHLPELWGSDKAAPVLVCEGEKDVATAELLGFVATTNIGGAGKWRTEYTAALKDRDVVIVPDNDKAGYKHAQKVAESLLETANRVRVVQLPDLRDKGDLSDWVQAGGTREQLQDLIDAADDYTPGAPPLAPTAVGTGTPKRYHLTDMGNGERLADTYRGDAHYCYDRKTWLVWQSPRWLCDEEAAIVSRAKDVIRDMYAEAATITDADRRAALVKHAIASEGHSRITAMCALARSEPGIPITTDKLDTHHWLLNVANGTLDLKTGTLQVPDKAHLMTKLLPVEWDASATCPTWERFLEQILPDAPLRTYVQKAIGYCLTGSVEEQELYFCHGKGSNGKSTLFATLIALFGEYGKQVPPQVLMLDRQSDRQQVLVGDLAGRRLVTSIELEEGKRFAESLVKQMTGSDTMTAWMLYKGGYTFEPTHKIWLAANHKPVIHGVDHAIWRRIRLIPFTVTIAENQKDKTLPAKLRAELPGILRWAVEGCLAWQKTGLQPPQAVVAATNKYRQEQDRLADFLSDAVVFGARYVVSKKGLYDAYVEWCKEQGEVPIQQRTFGAQLQDRSEIGEERSNKERRWTGIALSVDGHAEQEVMDLPDEQVEASAEGAKIRDAVTQVTQNAVNLPITPSYTQLLKTASPVSLRHGAPEGPEEAPDWWPEMDDVIEDEPL